MTRDRCERTWEIEALEDGRLEDKDRASLERHAATCAACTRARARLVELRDVLRRLPDAAPSELDRRRARGELLARANGAVVAPRRAPRWALPALVAATLLALVVLLVARREPRATQAVAGPRYAIEDVARADYTATRDGATAAIVLRAGVASFHVEHLAPGERFVVKVPDGEVEVRGTRFVVTVVDGRTRSVVVSEGVVDVRLAEFHGALRAGERWPAAAEPAVSGALGPSGSLAPATVASPSPSSSPELQPPSAPSLAPAASLAPPTASLLATASGALGPSAPTSASAAAAPSSAPGSRFAAAMAAYGAGDYGESERLFTAFARDFPADARVEDALFLVADGRARRGDVGGARSAARVYLGRYPEGLRAPAARRLAGEP